MDFVNDNSIDLNYLQSYDFIRRLSDTDYYDFNYPRFTVSGYLFTSVGVYQSIFGTGAIDKRIEPKRKQRTRANCAPPNIQFTQAPLPNKSDAVSRGGLLYFVHLVHAIGVF